jgi:hypothetical protein
MKSKTGIVHAGLSRFDMIDSMFALLALKSMINIFDSPCSGKDKFI